MRFTHNKSSQADSSNLLLLIFTDKGHSEHFEPLFKKKKVVEVCIFTHEDSS